MAKRVGDVVTLPGEGGDVQWEITAVESGLGDVSEST
jgi:transcription elongation GreA/GreB family factor